MDVRTSTSRMSTSQVISQLYCALFIKGASTTFQQVGWGMADMVECPGLSGMCLVFS